MDTPTVIIMTTDAQQLQLLLAWMSPAFPIGGFAYSHGLEFAIDDRQVTDAATLRQWIADIIERGSGWNDAVIFARCWADDPDALNELALALAGSRERYLETTSLGNAFLLAAATWAVQNSINTPLPLGERGRGEGFPRESAPRVFAETDAKESGFELESPLATLPQKADSRARCRALGSSPPAPSPPRGEGRFNVRFKDRDVAYPVAAGCFCHAASIDRSSALLAYLQGFASALISVAVRLIPLGQAQGLAVLRDLMPLIATTATRAETATLDDLGSATIGADIASMRHETQYSRVFRT
jgi:urease accessory protein